jgi:uncharacterized membrane protein
MPVYEKSVDVTVPVRVAYDQWTQFETFPAFMSAVDEVRQRTPASLHWITSIAGVRREFDTTIIEQRPDEKIAWRADNGPAQAGVVTFHPIGDDATRVRLRMELVPDGIAERAAAMTGMLGHRLQGDLNRFKSFVESRGGRQTGGWRGEITPEPGDDPTIGRTPGH